MSKRKRGVSIGQYDIFQNTLVESDFKNLKALGVDHVKMIAFAGHLVDESWNWKTSPRSGELVVNTWLRYITWASDAGLTVTPDIALYGEGVGSWLNNVSFWSQDNYQPFTELWGKLVDLFDSISGVVSYHILHVPGHKGKGVESDWYDIITPSCIEMIRSKSNKTISWMPFLMGWKDYEGYPCHTGYYATAELLPYSNIDYCFNHYADKGPTDSLTGGVTHECRQYDYNINPLLWHLKPAIDFKERTGVRMTCGEFGIDIIECGSYPPDPSRLGWVNDMLTLFQLYDFDWVYWNLAIPEGFGGDSFSIMNYDHTFRTELVNLLVSYTPPISPRVSTRIIIDTLGVTTCSMIGYQLGGTTGAGLGAGVGLALGEIFGRILAPPVETVCSGCEGRFKVSSYNTQVWCPYCGKEQMVGRG